MKIGLRLFILMTYSATKSGHRLASHTQQKRTCVMFTDFTPQFSKMRCWVRQAACYGTIQRETEHLYIITLDKDHNGQSFIMAGKGEVLVIIK